MNYCLSSKESNLRQCLRDLEDVDQSSICKRRMDDGMLSITMSVSQMGDAGSFAGYGLVVVRGEWSMSKEEC